jgi:hypothetical protein
MFLMEASRFSYQDLLIRKAVEGEPVLHFMRPNPISAPPSATIIELVDDYIYRYNLKMTPPVHIEGFDVGLSYRGSTAAHIIGGDFYDLINLGEGRMGLVIGDFAGRGIDVKAPSDYTALPIFCPDMGCMQTHESAAAVEAGGPDPAMPVGGRSLRVPPQT